MKSKIKYIYEQKYKWLLLIPCLLLLFSVIEIGWQYHTTGDFLHRGISLKGGSTIIINKNILESHSLSLVEVKNILTAAFPKADLDVRTLTSLGRVTSLAIDTDAQDSEEISVVINLLQKEFNLKEGDYSTEIMGSSLGNSFFKQLIFALLLAFLLMSIVVFIYFRLVIPSLAVILAAFCDIIVTMAIFNLTGIKLSSAGIAAFLMLVGYSVDTDMLLSSRLLKRKEGKPMDRIYSAIKTGLIMTLTTLVAVFIALIFVQSDVIKQIMIILFIGLWVDLIMTWIQNVGILRLYLEKKKKWEN